MKYTIILLAITVNAHMQMKYPLPRRSPFGSGPDIDYNMVAPLDESGSNFPCKSYPSSQPTATFKAGETIQVQMAGSAFHAGGHCQFSISYNDKDFVAIHTVMKNCFVGTGLAFPVKIPDDAPSCDKCTFSWSWVNAVGNREFYMNCADVKIIGTGSKLTGKQMVVANLPGRPSVPEFPPSAYDGSDLYQSAPTISISPSGSTESAPSTNASNKTGGSDDSTVLKAQSVPEPDAPKPAEAPNGATVNLPAPAHAHTHETTVNTGVCKTGASKCASDCDWKLCSNNVWFDMKCPLGTKCYCMIAEDWPSVISKNA